MFRSIAILILCCVGLASAEWIAGHYENGRYISGHYVNSSSAHTQPRYQSNNDGFGKISPATNLPRVKTFAPRYLRTDGTYIKGYCKSN
jgi:hypothetical protein